MAHTARRFPVLFVSHGSPTVLLDREYGDALRRFVAPFLTPSAFVVFSAHWMHVRPIRITSSERPARLCDVENERSWLARVSYPCRGAPALAAEIAAVLRDEGLPAVLDATRGLDHGAWLPLSIACPSARAPVVQVSLPSPATPAELLRMGRALAPLRDRRTFIVGSGGLVHNPHLFRTEGRRAPADPWAEEFDGWVHGRLAAGDIGAVMAYRTGAPHAHRAAPTPEHVDPLFVVLGATTPEDRLIDVYKGFLFGNLSLRTFGFGV